MSTKQQRTRSATRNADAAFDRHVRDLVGHTLDASDYGGNGHAQGRQGRAGHVMPRSDAHRQDGSFIPQSMYGKDGGVGFDDPAQDAYGAVDKKV